MNMAVYLNENYALGFAISNISRKILALTSYKQPALSIKRTNLLIFSDERFNLIGCPPSVIEAATSFDTLVIEIEGGEMDGDTISFDNCAFR